MTQKVDAMGQQNTITMKIKGDKVRVDVNPQISTIVNATTGEVTTLIHAQKMVMKMSGDQVKAMAQAATAQMGVAHATKPEVKATGKKDKINGYDVEEYTVTQGNVVSHAWIAKDYPNGKAVLDALNALNKGPLKEIAGAGAVEASVFPGLPLKTVVESSGKPATTVFLESVTEETIDPKQFTVPADYKSMEMPALPGR
ncbi:MAG TPA: DUF4412 domain-containing protein [Chthoniobacterales bacterium]